MPIPCPVILELSITSVFHPRAVNSNRKMSQSLAEANLLCGFQKSPWKELKGGKWRLEMGTTRQISKCHFLNVRFSSVCLRCWRLKFAFVSVLSPLPMSFLLFATQQPRGGCREDGAKPFSEAHSGRSSSSSQKFIQGKFRLGTTRHFFTASIDKQYSKRLSRETLKSPCWEICQTCPGKTLSNLLEVSPALRGEAGLGPKGPPFPLSLLLPWSIKYCPTTCCTA